MKSLFKVIVILIAVIFWLGAVNPILLNKSFTAAVVTKVIQEVKHKSGDEDWIQTKPMTQLKTKDLLSTGKKSVAVLKFVDGSILRVRENTTLMIFADKKDKGLIKNTKLENGKIIFDVNKQIDDDKFIITTPTAVATVRGTTGLVELLENGSTLVIVEKGIVDVEGTGESKEIKTLEAGNASVINPDGTITDIEYSEELKNKFLNSNKTNEKSIQIQTDKGNFRIYYLDTE